jgi:hypothetical protein
MGSTTHRSTIELTEPAREVERAAMIFARGERDTLPPQAIAKLRLAVELIMAIAPHTTRYQAERAVVDEFLICAKSKLAQVPDAADILRDARQRVTLEFSTLN